MRDLKLIRNVLHIDGSRKIQKAPPQHPITGLLSHVVLEKTRDRLIISCLLLSEKKNVMTKFKLMLNHLIQPGRKHDIESLNNDDGDPEDIA